MTTKEILKCDANKHQVIAIHKLYCSLIRLIGKAELNGHDLFAIADAIGVPRGLMGALKRDNLDDMTLTDYFRLKEFLYNTKLDDIDEWLGREIPEDDECDPENCKCCDFYDECEAEEKDPYGQVKMKNMIRQNKELCKSLEEDAKKLNFPKSESVNTCKDAEAFLDKTNSNLPKDTPKIDKDEALEAKKVADEDMQNEEEYSLIHGTANINGKVYEINKNTINNVMEEVQKALKNEGIVVTDDTKEAAQKIQDDVMASYDKAVKEAQMELFGDTEMLDKKTIGDLKYYIYKNGWDTEFDLELINHRQSVLLFLYRKLQELAEKKQKKSQNITKEQEENLNQTKKEAIKATKEEEKKINNNNKKYNNNTKPVDDIMSIFDFLRGFGITI